MRADSLHYSAFICPFESGKFGMEKLKKCEYVENEKSFLDERKIIVWGKNKR